MKADIPFLEYKAYKIREGVLKATSYAGSGHLTTALSAADMISALFFYAMNYDIKNPYDPNNDRFILSKGHGIPVVYAAYKEKGVISEEELLTYRKVDSSLEGHPTPRFIYNEAATGSLGQGLSIGLGMAFAANFSKRSYLTYVMLGDSEMTEGSVWEAIEISAYYKIDNLIALVDFNRLGQSTETIDDHHPKKHAERWNAFGWHTIIIDGHNMKQIVNALDQAKKIEGKPTVIIGKTYKGYGLKEVENKAGFHGKALPKEKLEDNLKELKQRFYKSSYVKYKEPELVKPRKLNIPHKEKIEFPIPVYKKGKEIPTRIAFGQTLAVAGEYLPELLSLDAEVKNSTYAEIFEEKFPYRFIQCFIAEQNMIGMATGLMLRDFTPVTSTFAAFLTRAHDQIRMAAIGKVPLRIAGSHAGVSIGEDGPSQMGLGDISLMRTLPSSIVLYPCDAVSTYWLINEMLNYQDGISYIRMTRMATPVIYNSEEIFEIGDCKILKQSNDDKACIIAAGVTLHEALKAYKSLKQEGIQVAVIDLYSIKPLAYEKIKSCVLKAQKRVITVEDHYLQGGLGEAVCYALRNDNIKIESLAIRTLPRSGKPEELLAMNNIDADSIIKVVKNMIK